MANKPVFGIIRCPNCQKSNLAVWDGNRKENCPYCHKKFTVKRTRMTHTMPVHRNTEETR